MPVQAPAEGFEARVARMLGHFASSASAIVARQLSAYCDLVVTWNQRVDLTAARSADELVDLLLADALAIAGATEALSSAGTATSNAREQWLDVGSGVGAPGIPLALLLPLDMTLVEPREKRVAFLRTAVGSLSRADITVRRARSDQFDDASCAVAVSRATLPPAEWLTEGARLANRGVWLLLAKAELPEIGSRRILADVRYRWPLTGAERRAVCVSAGTDPVGA
ncbi:MAG TPA: RsmG family class I SAM-dependent methyltransferase [Polyangiaceae bacterium]|nr:RsmG family class I SAM-dependent methyltransferase [Polyangiaceae bacterium]